MGIAWYGIYTILHYVLWVCHTVITLIIRYQSIRIIPIRSALLTLHSIGLHLVSIKPWHLLILSRHLKINYPMLSYLEVVHGIDYMHSILVIQHMANSIVKLKP